MLNPGAFEDRRSFEIRLAVVRYGIVACMVAVALAFWTLQVLEHTKYRDKAESQHLRTIPLRAPRGVLYDRNGRVLVESRDTFAITLIRELSGNEAALDDTLRRLAAVTQASYEDMRKTVDDAVRAREPTFRPLTLISNASEVQAASVKARQVDFPDIDVQRVPTRAYPQDGLGAQAFGYVSQLQAAQVDRTPFKGLKPGAIVGQSGVEMVYNARLMGNDGARTVAVDNKGREVDGMPQDMQPATGGQPVKLTIDYDLQNALDTAFRANGYAGAAVFLDPRNGEILAMTSQPTFDPNHFAEGIDRAEWAALQKDPLHPLSNRLLQGRYSPGSTFKILMATAGLAEGVITPETRFYCAGSKDFYGKAFGCDKKDGHGWLDLRQAIEKSCNIYFYSVGDLLKIDTIYEYAQKLGLAGKTGIDLPGEVESLIPNEEWKQRTFHEKWYPGETISVSIGQGAVSVTPIGLANMMATVANGGTAVTPHVVMAVDEGKGWVPVVAPQPRPIFPMRPDIVSAVHDGLWMVVNGAGTGGNARIQGRDVSGKTGTAQVISNTGKAKAKAKGSDADLRDNGWFVFFAPRDNPQIAGVVIAEHAGHGATSAAPIAKFVLETFFAKQDGKPLPVFPAPVKVVASR